MTFSYEDDDHVGAALVCEEQGATISKIDWVQEAYACSNPIHHNHHNLFRDISLLSDERVFSDAWTQ